jgi:CheY-like chemotaxis protein
LLFRIVDTGIGITEEQRTKIFNPFEQGDNTMTRRFGGTGLGLAITEHIVQLMGGSIRLESTPGQGSCFEVRLPYLSTGIVERSSVETAKSTMDDGPRRLAGLRILVAEDIEINREIMQEILTDMGASPTLVTNGKEAVDAVRSQASGAFDVVLMDIQMPVMNGHQAAREIRAIAPDLPVIGQTAHALAEERKACLASGMVAHISKPIDPDKLATLILQNTKNT